MHGCSDHAVLDVVIWRVPAGPPVTALAAPAAAAQDHQPAPGRPPQEEHIRAAIYPDALEQAPAVITAQQR